LSHFYQVVRFLSSEDCLFIGGGFKAVQMVHVFAQIDELPIGFADFLDAEGVA
jgi:hypothetical protein